MKNVNRGRSHSDRTNGLRRNLCARQRGFSNVRLTSCSFLSGCLDVDHKLIGILKERMAVDLAQ